MSWPKRKVQSWTDLTGILDSISTVATPLSVGYLFRGQADAEWSLLPSIARMLRGQTTQNAIEAEKIGLAEFKSQAHLYLSQAILAGTTDITGWWSLMQHYRAPTRFLDWTASPYVAAYFAVEDHWGKDGAVWLFAVADLTKQMEAKYGPIELTPPPGRDTKTHLDMLLLNPASPPQLLVVRREVSTERMVAQQGGFTVCRQPLLDHAQAIDEVLSPISPCNYLQLIIPSGLKGDVPEFVERMS